MKKISVLCVDDSALVRGLMTEIINSQPDMEVVATAPDPLAPLRDVRFSVLGVGINFALALGSVAAFGYWRRIERTRASRAPVKGPGR